MPTGFVKWFRADLGFGFLVRDDGAPDVFVHARELAKSGIAALDTGQRVSFEVGPDKVDHRVKAHGVAVMSDEIADKAELFQRSGRI